MRALQMPEGTEFVGLQLRRLPASVTAASNSASNLLARARPTHLDGVRERFLRHFSTDELVLLAELWERILPGAAATPE